MPVYAYHMLSRSLYIYMPLYAIICHYMPLYTYYMPLYAVICLLYASILCCPLFLSMVFSLKQRVMKMVSWNRKGLQRRWSPQLNGAINGNTSSASMVNIDRTLWKDPPDLKHFDEKNLSISTGPFSRALYSHYQKVCLSMEGFCSHLSLPEVDSLQNLLNKSTWHMSIFSVPVPSMCNVYK